MNETNSFIIIIVALSQRMEEVRKGLEEEEQRRELQYKTEVCLPENLFTNTNELKFIQYNQYSTDSMYSHAPLQRASL